jgi:polysaccharide export outer membrane protein
LCALVSISTLSAFGQTTDPAPTAQGGRDERYRIGFEDRLDVTVFRHPELSGRVAVNPNGTINLFRLTEPIIAICKTEREVADAIAAAYKKDYLRDPQVTVLAAEQRSRAFNVIGAVEKPGKYMIGRRVRLLELLSEAGGPSKEAGTRVLVARLGSTSTCRMGEDSASNPEDLELLDFKLKDILEAKENLVMRPGDVVSVMDADVVYVYGNVNKQGQVQIKEPLTLTQALASAEGLKSASDRGKVKVLRQKPGSTDRDEFVYNLDDITKRKVPDPFLEPNDVVAVNTDKTKEIFQSIGRSLTNGIPSLFYRVP